MNFAYLGICARASAKGMLICSFLNIFRIEQTAYQKSFACISGGIEVGEYMA